MAETIQRIPGTVTSTPVWWRSLVLLYIHNRSEMNKCLYIRRGTTGPLDIRTYFFYCRGMQKIVGHVDTFRQEEVSIYLKHEISEAHLVTWNIIKYGAALGVLLLQQEKFV